MMQARQQRGALQARTSALNPAALNHAVEQRVLVVQCRARGGLAAVANTQCKEVLDCTARAQADTCTHRQDSDRVDGFNSGTQTHRQQVQANGRDVPVLGHTSLYSSNTTRWLSAPPMDTSTNAYEYGEVSRNLEYSDLATWLYSTGLGALPGYRSVARAHLKNSSAPPMYTDSSTTTSGDRRCSDATPPSA